MSANLLMRDDVIEKLQRLCSGQESRENVAAWAMSIINDDFLSVTDQWMWSVLKRLGAVDLVASDREFLYATIDFNEWLLELL